MQFGAYTAERPVEQRGNVTIYAAKHDSSGDAALITVFTPQTMSEAYRWAERLTEIQKLHHANLTIPVEGQRTAEGVAFAISPLVPPLLGRDRVLSPFATVEVMRQISAALDYAHGQGVVHGTIKPGHIGKIGENRYVLRRSLALIMFDAGKAHPRSRYIALTCPIHTTRSRSFNVR